MVIRVLASMFFLCIIFLADVQAEQGALPGQFLGVDSTPAGGMSRSTIPRLAMGAHGQVFYAGASAIFEFDGIAHQKHSLPTRREVKDFVLDKDEVLWVLTQRHLFRGERGASGVFSFERVLRASEVELPAGADIGGGIFVDGGSVYIYNTGVVLRYDGPGQVARIVSEPGWIPFIFGWNGRVFGSAPVAGLFEVIGDTAIPVAGWERSTDRRHGQPRMLVGKDQGRAVLLMGDGDLVSFGGGAPRFIFNLAAVMGVSPESIDVALQLKNGNYAVALASTGVFLLDGQGHEIGYHGFPGLAGDSRAWMDLLEDKRGGLWIINRQRLAWVDLNSSLRVVRDRENDPIVGVRNIEISGRRVAVLGEAGLHLLSLENPEQAVRIPIPELGWGEEQWMFSRSSQFYMMSGTSLFRVLEESLEFIQNLPDSLLRLVPSGYLESRVFGLGLMSLKIFEQADDGTMKTLHTLDFSGMLPHTIHEVSSNEAWVELGWSAVGQLVLDSGGRSRLTIYGAREGLPPGEWVAPFLSGGVCYFRTSETGIYRFDADSGRFQLVPELTAQFPSPLAEIDRVYPDKAGNLWVSGRMNGVLRFVSEAEYVWEPLRFGSLEPIRFHAVAHQGDLVWLGGEPELVVMDAAALDPGQVPPEVGLRVMRRDAETLYLPGRVSEGEPFVFSEKPERLSFEFFLMEPALAKAFRIQTWLDPVDGGWQDWVEGNRPDFVRLPPGAYTMRVRAVSDDGVQGVVNEFAFFIPKPWYLTYFFMGLMVVLVSGLIALGIHCRGRALRQENDRLEHLVTCRTRDLNEANNAKIRFLAQISHEVRTPMNGVIGMARMLGQSSLREDQRQYVETIERSGETLLSMINGILDLSRIDAGKLSLENIAFDVHQAVEDCIRLLEPQAREKRLALRVHGLLRVPLTMKGDPTRLRQILLNLLSNAVKFTDSGSVDLFVSFVSTSMGEPGLRFIVVDTGPGMAADARRRLFQPFEQLERSTNRLHGGAGLGLHITRNLVELMGGTIEFESAPGRGTRFTVVLPFGRIQTGPGLYPSPSGRAPQRKVPRLLHCLVADDNAVNQRVCGSFVQRLGHSVEYATNGADVLEMVKSGRFDAVLMDMWMPLMNGIEATRALRRGDGGKGFCRIPIIGVTAGDADENVSAFIAAGLNACLHKPLSMKALEGALESVIKELPPVGKSV